MPKRTEAETVSKQIKRIAEAMGSPSDLRVMPVGAEGLSHLLYLNSLVDDKTIAWVTGQLATFPAVPAVAWDLPVTGRIRPLADSGAAVEVYWRVILSSSITCCCWPLKPRVG